MKLTIATDTRARVQATKYAPLSNAEKKNRSVLVIDGERVTALAVHDTQAEAVRALSQVKGGAR
jgi:hypothetical protein